MDREKEHTSQHKPCAHYTYTRTPACTRFIHNTSNGILRFTWGQTRQHDMKWYTHIFDHCSLFDRGETLEFQWKKKVKQIEIESNKDGHKDNDRDRKSDKRNVNRRIQA